MKMKERENRHHHIEADGRFQRSRTDIFFFLLLLLLLPLPLLLLLLYDNKRVKKGDAHSVSLQGRRKKNGIKATAPSGVVQRLSRPANQVQP